MAAPVPRPIAEPVNQCAPGGVDRNRDMDEHSQQDLSYPVELLCRGEPQLDPELLGKVLSGRLGGVRRRNDAPAGELHFILDRNGMDAPGDPGIVRLVYRAAETPGDRDGLHGALDQSWDVDDAAARLETCQYAVSVTGVTGPGLPDLERRRIISAGLMALLDLVQAELVFWPKSGQLLDPARTRARLSEPGQLANPTYGFVNVRLFTVEEDGTTIMDTLGLGALGLTDLQVRFTALEKARVADLLYSVAAYLLENGDVIDNGHTIPGLEAGARWTCMHDVALVAPERLVLNINPDSALH